MLFSRAKNGFIYWMVGLDFGIDDLKAWIHPALH